MRPGRSRLLLLPALLAAACGLQGPPDDAEPLLDERFAPLVLSESAQLEPPPAYSGNRFLSGWWPWRRGGAIWQVNVADRAVLEAVFLDGRERRLITRLEVGEAAPGATFGVRVAGVDLPPQPLVPDAEVELPGGLPLGRLPIELDLRGARVAVLAAGFGHAWQAGEVELAAERILQGGYSAIDFPRRMAAPATLFGEFEPPGRPQPDQRFAVLVETDAGGSEVAFEWRPAGGRERPGRQPFRLPLPAGFVRLRLLAQGLGEPGVWHGLVVAGGRGGGADAQPRLDTAAGRAGPAYVAASPRYELVRTPDLGLSPADETGRDAEYLFDLRRDPDRGRNLAGARAVEIDWLRSRLDASMAREGS